MSKTGVIVALLLALVLTGAAVLLGGKGRGPAASPGPLLGFEPSAVRELRLTHADGTFEAIRRGASAGAWVVVLSRGGSESEWPAEAGRARAALRILSTLEGDDASQGGPEQGAPVLRIMLDDHSERVMRISSRTLGGKVLTEITTPAGSRAAMIGADAASMLTTGPREWRDQAALPGLGADISRITLRGERGTLSLGRVRGRWALREPIAEAADQEAVLRLAGILGGVRITDFLDAGAPEHTGVDTPVAEIAVMSEQRDEEGKIHSETRTLRVGQQADIAGKTVFAAIPASASTFRTVVVSADGLSGLTTDPAAYVSRRTLQVPAADIGAVAISSTGGSRRFQRELEGWASVGPDGAKTPCVKADADALAAVINLLTQMPADAAEVTPSAPSAWGSASVAGAVEVFADGPLPVASIGILTVANQGKSTQLATQAGQVFRRYPVDASSPLIAWLMRGP